MHDRHLRMYDKIVQSKIHVANKRSGVEKIQLDCQQLIKNYSLKIKINSSMINNRITKSPPLYQNFMARTLISGRPQLEVLASWAAYDTSGNIGKALSPGR